MTIYTAIGVLAAVVGLVGAYALVTAAQRRAATPKQAQRWRYAIIYSAMTLVGGLLIYNAIRTDTGVHRYLDLTVVAIMVAGVGFDWIRARRKRHRT